MIAFQGETWWSGVARLGLAACFDHGPPMRRGEVAVPDCDPDPKALVCYGRWLPAWDEIWLRFVDCRPVGAITTQFLDWCADEASRAAAPPGITTIVLFRDNATATPAG